MTPWATRCDVLRVDGRRSHRTARQLRPPPFGFWPGAARLAMACDRRSSRDNFGIWAWRSCKDVSIVDPTGVLDGVAGQWIALIPVALFFRGHDCALCDGVLSLPAVRCPETVAAVGGRAFAGRLGRDGRRYSRRSGAAGILLACSRNHWCDDVPDRILVLAKALLDEARKEAHPRHGGSCAGGLIAGAD